MDELKPYTPPKQEISRQVQPTIDLGSLTQEEILSPTYYGKLLETIPKVSGKDAVEDRGKLNFRRNDVMLTIDKMINNIPVIWGINVDKLLCVSMGAFIMANPGLTLENHKKIRINYEVKIPFKSFCMDMGYDVIPHDGSPAEKRRANATLRKAKQRILSYLECLREVKATWIEALKKGGKSIAKEAEAGAIDRNFINYSIIGSRGIVDGFIDVTFDPKFVNDYLILLPQNKYHKALLKVKKETAYKMGRFLINYYMKPSNKKKVINNHIRNKKLLAHTDLPTIEEIEGAIDPDTGRRKGGKRPGHWRERIKEPYEEALDELYSVGFLTFWGYYGKNKRKLSDKEATEGGAEMWGERYLDFEIRIPVDNEGRLTTTK